MAKQCLTRTVINVGVLSADVCGSEYQRRSGARDYDRCLRPRVGVEGAKSTGAPGAPRCARGASGAPVGVADESVEGGMSVSPRRCDQRVVYLRQE